MIAREAAWAGLHETFDVLVVGGGVTGAAVAFEAARRGLRAALVEREDYASGTSSRSSKLIHGGLRYLKEGKIGLTRESVREREELLRGAPGLVDPIAFVMPHYRGRKPGRTTLSLGLALYDALAGSWQHRYVSRDETLELVPDIDPVDLTGAHCYLDATTDDARLVMRLIEEACDAGAVAINYVSAEPLLEDGVVCGVRLDDRIGSRRLDVRARAVVNATGAWADELRAGVGAQPRLRPLRGSHLVVPDWRLPLAQSVAFEHPHDGRPVFAYPWLGRTLVGTTDLDHDADLDREPSITPQEVAYLIDALRFQFPALGIGAGDVIATFAGVRPVVDSARDAAPSRASRDHVVWNERGLITITGGKLTTFRPMALDALAAAAPRLPSFDRTARPVFRRAPMPDVPHLARTFRRRLAGRYGTSARALVEGASAADLQSFDTTGFLWGELRWAARREAVVHLDDLLLRRTRVGLLTAGGGARHFERIGTICRAELGWSDDRWNDELNAYRTRWNDRYGVPAAS